MTRPYGIPETRVTTAVGVVGSVPGNGRSPFGIHLCKELPTRGVKKGSKTTAGIAFTPTTVGPTEGPTMCYIEPFDAPWPGTTSPLSLPTTHHHTHPLNRKIYGTIKIQNRPTREVLPRRQIERDYGSHKRESEIDAEASHSPDLVATLDLSY